jgi:hypothetical protein
MVRSNIFWVENGGPWQGPARISVVSRRLVGLSVEELKRESLRGAVTGQRQVPCIWPSSSQTLLSRGDHALFWPLHHTTVMHSIVEVEQQRRTDRATNVAIRKLLNILKTD